MVLHVEWAPQQRGSARGILVLQWGDPVRVARAVLRGTGLAGMGAEMATTARDVPTSLAGPAAPADQATERVNSKPAMAPHVASPPVRVLMQQSGLASRLPMPGHRNSNLPHHFHAGRKLADLQDDAPTAPEGSYIMRVQETQHSDQPTLQQGSSLTRPPGAGPSCEKRQKCGAEPQMTANRHTKAAWGNAPTAPCTGHTTGRHGLGDARSISRLMASRSQQKFTEAGQPHNLASGPRPPQHTPHPLQATTRLGPATPPVHSSQGRRNWAKTPVQAAQCHVDRISSVHTNVSSNTAICKSFAYQHKG